MVNRRPSVEEVLRKYGAKIESQVEDYSSDSGQVYSQAYQQFRSEMVEKYSGYEKWCHTVGSFIRMKPSRTDEERVKKYIEAAHLNIEPWQAIGLGVTAFILLFFIGILVSVAVLLMGNEFPVLFFLLCVVFGLFVFYFSQNYPERLALKWRLKASSQMVPAILYIVVYMRHTPNLEKAIAFAADHLEPPLAMDFKKIFYDVEVRKYSTIKESLDAYLESWRDYSTEFIEGFHLIESSLFEPDQGRRISTLEKALQVVLDGVYDKMLKFSHNVRAPITNVYMLGVVMPTLGLALIPLASAMVQGMIGTVHIFLLFNLIVPFLVFFLTDKILVMRPGGHGNTSLLERNPLYYKFKSSAPYTKAFLIVLPLFLLSLVPLLYQFPWFYEGLGLQQDYTFAELGLGMIGGEENFFGYSILKDGTVRGPFGLGSVLLGLLFPISIALFFGMSYSERTKEMMIERQNTLDLEKEFNNSLFQLGNRLGNGVPPELVFAKVAESNRGLKTGDFFGKVNYNIQSQGMSVEGAIFDEGRGALKSYPSNLIATSMRVLVESAKKGLKIAAVSLMSISEYVKNMGKIKMRLKDLLAEVTGDMKSNMSFLAPLLSGIVVGLAAMITLILGKIDVAGLEGVEMAGAVSTISSLFSVDFMIPPYFLQISVGIYLIEIIFILTAALVVIDSGEDKLAQTNMAGNYLKKGILLFFITAFISTVVLSVLGASVLGGIFS
jgi:hypothetical protein